MKFGFSSYLTFIPYDLFYVQPASSFNCSGNLALQVQSPVSSQTKIRESPDTMHGKGCLSSQEMKLQNPFKTFEGHTLILVF
ncbi:hypothetical protein LINPERPRIM_LOCUS8077 [Linum perenne]